MATAKLPQMKPQDLTFTPAVVITSNYSGALMANALHQGRYTGNFFSDSENSSPIRNLSDEIVDFTQDSGQSDKSSGESNSRTSLADTLRQQAYKPRGPKKLEHELNEVLKKLGLKWDGKKLVVVNSNKLKTNLVNAPSKQYSAVMKFMNNLQKNHPDGPKLRAELDLALEQQLKNNPNYKPTVKPVLY